MGNFKKNVFNRISEYNGGWQVTMVTGKRISRMKRTFFIENVKDIFVLSILQTVSGTNTPIKSYCTFVCFIPLENYFFDKTC